LDCQLIAHKDCDTATSLDHDSGNGKQRLLMSLDSTDCASHTKGVSNTQRSNFLKMHVLVVATEEPDVPVDLFRAAARGIPIVATAVDGVKDIFTDGLNSLLVAPWDHSALARAVETIMRDDLLAQRIGEGGRKLAETMNVSAEQTGYRKTYARLLDRNY
jgi:glycosyltransferase involved in cell wall biosynthesis